MAKLSRAELELLAQVNASYPAFVAWLKARQIEGYGEVSNQRDEVSLRWAQGRVQELTDLVSILESAASKL